MRIAQLQYFYTVCCCESFTGAAEILFISQSSLSKQIMALERELGIQLFERSSRHVRLTSAARMILPYTETILKQKDAIMHEIEEYKMKFAKVIRLCGLPVLYPYGLSDAIFHFEQLHKDCRVEITETITPELLGNMMTGKADIGIVRFDLTDYVAPDGLRLIPLIDDKQVLVVPKESPLAARGRIHLSEAAKEDFIQFNTDTIISAYHIRLLNKHIPSASLHLTTMKMDSIKSCILTKGWVSLMMQKVAESYYQHSDASILELDEDHIILTLCLMVRRDEKSAPSISLINYLREHFQDQKYRS